MIVVLLHIENPLILPVNVVISTYITYVFAARIRKWEGENLLLELITAPIYDQFVEGIS